MCELLVEIGVLEQVVEAMDAGRGQVADKSRLHQSHADILMRRRREPAQEGWLDRHFV